MPGPSNIYTRKTTSAKSTNTLVVVQVKPLKAACHANQDAVDRMQEAFVQAQANANNSKYVHTLRRAIKSLVECNEPITTRGDAQKLKFVGSALAKMICPQLDCAVAGATAGTETTTATTTRAGNPGLSASATTTTTTTAASKKRTQGTDQTAFVPPPPRGPTAKERAYEKARDEADRLQVLLPPSSGSGQGQGGAAVFWKVILLVDGRERKSEHVVSACRQSGIPCEERHLPIGDMAWIVRSCCTRSPLELMAGTIIERKEVNDLASSLYGTRYNEQRLRLSQCGVAQVLFLVEGDLTQVDNCPPETLHMAMMETRVQLGFQIVQTRYLAETVGVLKGLHRRIVRRTFPDAFARDPPPPGGGGGGGGGEGDVGVGTTNVPNFRRDATSNDASSRRRRNRRASSLLEMVFDTAPVPPFGAERFVTYPELKAKVELDRERGTRSVKALTLAMLKQVPTLSQKKCTALAQVYPTMNRLLEALTRDDHHGGRPETLLQTVPMDANGRRTVGPRSAAEVYAACCTLEDGSTVASRAAAPAVPAASSAVPAAADAFSAAPTAKRPPASVKSKAKGTSSTRAAKAANPRKTGDGIVAGVNRFLSTALKSSHSSDANTVEAAASRLIATKTNGENLNPNIVTTVLLLQDDDSSASSRPTRKRAAPAPARRGENDATRSAELLSPPRKQRALGDRTPIICDLLTPEVKSTRTVMAAAAAALPSTNPGLSKATNKPSGASMVSHKVQGPAAFAKTHKRPANATSNANANTRPERSFLLSSPEENPLPPPSWRARPEEYMPVAKKLAAADIDDEHGRFGSRKPPSHRGVPGGGVGAAHPRGLKRAPRAKLPRLSDESSSESTMFSPTPPKDKPARTVSDESPVKPTPGEDLNESKTHRSSSSSSPSICLSDDDDRGEMTSLRERIAKKLDREVIAIDSD